MTKRDFPPIHPGEILAEDFLSPMEINPTQLAAAINVPVTHITAIMEGNQPLTADIALRLGHFFKMEAQFWLNLQTRYDLETTRALLADRLEREVLVYAGA